VLLAASLLSQQALSYVAPTAPETFDTSYAPPNGAVINVNSGDSLQAAINSAQLGDTIVLQAGAAFSGPITLPNKTSGSGWVYIRSSAYGSLPDPGTRVGPADAAAMPKITAKGTGGTAIGTAAGAHHFRFVGIEITPASGNFIYNLISIGNSDTSLSTLPSNIVFDRCYIHAEATLGGRRGVAMDGKYVAVVDSYVSGFREQGADSQALWAYNTPGPLKIVNNYLEAAGENVMFGGADAQITNVSPSDIEIRGNLFFKPTSWINSSWTVKNLLEFKNAKRALVVDNRFENNWAAAQNGFSILVTPRNQNGSAPWSGVQDISIIKNVLVNLGQAFNIAGRDDANTSTVTQRILIQDNVVGITSLNGAAGRFLQTISGPVDVTVDHNTWFNATGESYHFAENSPKAVGFTFTNNLGTKARYGFLGTGQATVLNTLAAYFSSYVLTKNAIIGTNDTSSYPAGNYFPSDVVAVKFVDYANGDYRLAASSPYKNAGTDGKDLGADLTGVSTAQGPVKPMAPSNFSIEP
jgi:hypothetical protein